MDNENVCFVYRVFVPPQIAGFFSMSNENALKNVATPESTGHHLGPGRLTDTLFNDDVIPLTLSNPRPEWQYWWVQEYRWYPMMLHPLDSWRRILGLASHLDPI